MRIQTSRKSGFTLVEIMIVVAIIGLLAAIAIPNFVHARETAQKNACIANLKQIDGAKDQYAIEEKKKTADTVSMDNLVPNYIKVEPKCPSGTAAYVPGNIGTTPTCPNNVTGHTIGNS